MLTLLARILLGFTPSGYSRPLYMSHDWLTYCQQKRG